MGNWEELNTTPFPQLQAAGVEGKTDKQTKPHPMP